MCEPNRHQSRTRGNGAATSPATKAQTADVKGLDVLGRARTSDLSRVLAVSRAALSLASCAGLSPGAVRRLFPDRTPSLKANGWLQSASIEIKNKMNTEPRLTLSVGGLEKEKEKIGGHGNGGGKNGGEIS